MHETYRRLAEATPGSEYVEYDFGSGYVGPFPHAIGNYLIVERLTSNTVDTLSRLNDEQSAMLVYVPFAKDTAECEALTRADFGLVTSYQLMVSMGKELSAMAAPTLASTIGERHRVVSFMAEQFFPNSEKHVRDQMIASTTLSMETELYYMKPSRDMVAACMLSDSVDCVGLYNLCVKTLKRGAGIGTALAKFALHCAHSRGKVFCLQCRPELEPFYQRLGLETVGCVQVLSKFAKESL